MFESDYVLLSAERALDLEALVKARQQVGWRCQGGASVTLSQDSKKVWFYQAMVLLPPMPAESAVL